MKFIYRLERPYNSKQGLIEEYVSDITHNELKQKYTFVARLSRFIGYKNKIRNEEKSIYSTVMSNFIDAISESDFNLNTEWCQGDKLIIEAKNINKASSKLEKFNNNLDCKLSRTLNKNYHLNLRGILFPDNKTL